MITGEEEKRMKKIIISLLLFMILFTACDTEDDNKEVDQAKSKEIETVNVHYISEEEAKQILLEKSIYLKRQLENKNYSLKTFDSNHFYEFYVVLDEVQMEDLIYLVNKETKEIRVLNSLTGNNQTINEWYIPENVAKINLLKELNLYHEKEIMAKIVQPSDIAIINEREIDEETEDIKEQNITSEKEEILVEMLEDNLENKEEKAEEKKFIFLIYKKNNKTLNQEEEIGNEEVVDEERMNKELVDEEGDDNQELDKIEIIGYYEYDAKTGAYIELKDVSIKEGFFENKPE